MGALGVLREVLQYPGGGYWGALRTLGVSRAPPSPASILTTLIAASSPVALLRAWGTAKGGLRLCWAPGTSHYCSSTSQ